ncbi:uncharacterized protein TNCV_237971 [Trichonephila clavipes]|nr:uncharacterized protein TNCV_237971 [Trichonephila clavipes]
MEGHGALTDLTCFYAFFTSLGSYPGEGMDFCKCIVPLWHVGTLNRRPAASPLMRLVEGEERWKFTDPLGVIDHNLGGTDLNRNVPCMVLKAAATYRLYLGTHHDEFCAPGSDIIEIRLHKKQQKQI